MQGGRLKESIWLCCMLVLVHSISINSVVAQALEANHWYFGFESGLRFVPSGPKPELNGLLRATYGAASVSDKNGNLLFYTDNRHIYNCNHDTLKNGSFALRTGVRIIEKQPNSEYYYWIFSVESAGINASICNYTLIDMRLDSARGSIVMQGQISETVRSAAIAIFNHQNGQDKWVLLLSNNSDSFYAYVLNSNGFQASSPHVSRFNTNRYNMSNVTLKSSPNSKYLSAVSTFPANEFVLYEFNNSNGTVFTPFFSVKSSSSISDYTSTAFSPNSESVFLSHRNKLEVYSIKSKDSIIINNSKTQLTSNLNLNHLFWDLQIGIDGCLYFLNGAPAFQISRKISRIKCPDNIFDTVIIEDTIIGPLGIVLGNQLPTLNQTLYVNTHKLQAQSTGDTLLCVGDSTQLTAYGAGADQFVWSPAHGLSCTNCPSPKAAPDSSITYRVIGTASACAQDNIDTAYVRIDVVPPKGSASIIGDSVLCDGERITLRAPAGFTSYHWLHNNFTSPATFVDTPGTYLLALSGKCYNDTLVQKVSIETALSYRFPNDTSICPNDFPIALNASSNYPLFINDSLTNDVEVHSTGTWNFKTESKCSSATKNVLVDTLPLEAKIAPENLPDSLNVGDSLLLDFFALINTDPFPSQSLFIPDSSGTYSLHQLRSNGSCSDTLFIKQIYVQAAVSDTISSKCAIDVSPNPGEDLLNIKSNMGIERLSVYDMQGKLIMQFEAASQNAFSFEIPNLAAGTYLIQATCMNQERYEMKWMRR